MLPCFKSSKELKNKESMLIISIVLESSAMYCFISLTVIVSFSMPELTIFLKSISISEYYVNF